MKFLPSSEDDYMEALRYFRQQFKSCGTEQSKRLYGLAVEAIRFAAIRKENRWLNKNHLLEMNGLPVYFSGNPNCGEPQRGGIVDVQRGAVILIDSVEGGLRYHPINWEICGNRLRWPDDEVDLLDFCD